MKGSLLAPELAGPELAGPELGRPELAGVAERARPVAMAGVRRLEVGGAIGGLFPDGGMQRGWTVGVGRRGGVSLSLALAAGVMAGREQWAAVVGLPSLGLVAAAGMGVPLERLALVPRPGERWPAVVAALLDGVDLLVLASPRVRSGDARRLMARARERGSVLVVLEGASPGAWPESPDLRIEMESSSWSGLGNGHGRLPARRVEVSAGGRRGGGRRRRVGLWLPGPGGVVEEAVVPHAGGAPDADGVPVVSLVAGVG